MGIPAIAHGFLGLHQDLIFVRLPRPFLDRGIEVIKPALPALLADSTRDSGRDLGPLCYPRADARQNTSIFVFRPRSFHQPRFEHLLPTMQTLDVGATILEMFLGNLLPVLGADLVNAGNQERVLLF